MMHAWEQIQLTLDYIDEHLDQKLEIETLAQIAALSPFYFQRLFSRLVKKTVAEYVKLRRMAKAVTALLDTDRRMLDIALELGFSSHEHFSRSFKETFGMTPDDYRRNPCTLNRMTKPQLLLRYTLIDEGVPLIADGIVLEINRQKVGTPVPFTGLQKKMPVQFVEGLGVDSGVDPLGLLWQDFHDVKAQVVLPDGVEVGVSHPCPEEGYFLYFAGGEAKPGPVPDGYTGWELPSGEYIVCSFEAENFEGLVVDVLYKAQQYLFNTWLPRHQLTTEPFCMERYTAHTPETTSMEVWVKIR